MIHVTKDRVAVAGPAPQILAEISMVIASITGSMKRDGASEDALRHLFQHVVDVGIQASDIPAATIDMSFRMGREEKT